MLGAGAVISQTPRLFSHTFARHRTGVLSNNG